MGRPGTPRSLRDSVTGIVADAPTQQAEQMLAAVFVNCLWVLRCDLRFGVLLLCGGGAASRVWWNGGAQRFGVVPFWGEVASAVLSPLVLRVAAVVVICDHHRPPREIRDRTGQASHRAFILPHGRFDVAPALLFLGSSSVICLQVILPAW